MGHEDRTLCLRRDRPFGQELDDGSALEIEGDLFASYRVTDRKLRIDKLLAPLVPADILCIGLNYRDHAAEGGFDVPANPMLFIKAGNTLNNPLDPIPLPRRSDKIDYEGELAVVIGKAAKYVSRADALDYVFGYTCANDVSARDWQREKALGGGQFARGKSFDGFCPLGPRIVTRDEIPDPQALRAPHASQRPDDAGRHRVAEKIAREIKGWIDSGRPLGPRGRPVTADDVLILVQVRSVLFHEIIRALIQHGHADARRRPAGGDHPYRRARPDGAGRRAQQSGRRPAACGAAALAAVRGERGRAARGGAAARPRTTRLWSALERSSIPSVKAAHRAAAATGAAGSISSGRSTSTPTCSIADGGLQEVPRAASAPRSTTWWPSSSTWRWRTSRSPQPSLLGFLAELRAREVTIKRELGEAGSGVRVMTVHGAKGLEAPIVILADAATHRGGRDRRAIFMSAEPPLFFHASSKETHVAETMEHRDDAEAAQKAEYWRKLYVAMTRAEDELYVTGTLTKTRQARRQLVRGDRAGAAAAGARCVTRCRGQRDGADLSARARGRRAGAVDRGAPARDRRRWSCPTCPRYQLRRIVRPSIGFADDADPEHVLDTRRRAARAIGAIPRRRDARASRSTRCCSI